MYLINSMFPQSSRNQKGSTNYSHTFSRGYNQSVESIKADIQRLKQQKSELIEEKKQLKVKLARMEQKRKRGNQITTMNNSVFQKLEQEQSILEDMIEEQKKQILALTMSDEAAQRQELQEESKILYLEQLRLFKEREKQQKQYEQSQNDFDELLEKDGPNILDQQEEKIQKLQDKLFKYEKANKKLENKLNQIKAENEAIDLEYQEAVQKKVETLQRQINEAREIANQNRAKIEKAKKDHEKLMQSLRQQADDSETTL